METDGLKEVIAHSIISLRSALFKKNTSYFTITNKPFIYLKRTEEFNLQEVYSFKPQKL